MPSPSYGGCLPLWLGSPTFLRVCSLSAGSNVSSLPLQEQNERLGTFPHLTTSDETSHHRKIKTQKSEHRIAFVLKNPLCFHPTLFPFLPWIPFPRRHNNAFSSNSTNYPKKRHLQAYKYYVPDTTAATCRSVKSSNFPSLSVPPKKNPIPFSSHLSKCVSARSVK